VADAAEVKDAANHWRACGRRRTRGCWRTGATHGRSGGRSARPTGAACPRSAASGATSRSPMTSCACSRTSSWCAGGRGRAPRAGAAGCMGAFRGQDERTQHIMSLTVHALQRCAWVLAGSPMPGRPCFCWVHAWRTRLLAASRARSGLRRCAGRHPRAARRRR